MSSGKLFQTAGAPCEKARSAKARLVRSCTNVLCVCTMCCDKNATTEKNCCIHHQTKSYSKEKHRVSVLVELSEVHDAGVCTLVIFWQPVDAVVAGA